MKIVVGLGNPGKEYDRTYHNIGFMAVDKLAEKLGVSINKGKFNSLFGLGKIGDEIVAIVKPLTYMNNSGQAVSGFAKYYKVAAGDIFVFCDDIDLEKGVARFREHGSGGTHNGLRDIVRSLGSEDFRRIKIGAGNDKNMDLKDYVLSKIDEQSMQKINIAIDDGIENFLAYVAPHHKEI